MLLMAGPAFAQAPAVPADADTAKTKTRQTAPPPLAPRLETTAPATILPEALHNLTRRQAPQSIHQRKFGVFNRDGGAPSGFGPVARYGVDRAQENWSYLRDPTLSDDRLDGLKFIPLNEDKSVYLTLSFDQRIKAWYESAPFLGQQKPKHSARLINRTVGGADLHLGPYFRVYAELLSGQAGGWNAYGYNQTYRKTVDAQQLFAEAEIPLDTAKLGMIVGRQEFFDAPNYVLYVRETPNLPISWNGLRAYVFWPRLRVDVFDLVQTNTLPTAPFADTENYQARLFGAYTSLALPDFRFLGAPGHVFLDAFYLGYDVAGSGAALATAAGTANGTTHRDNPGVRLWGKAGPIEFSLGGLAQTGSFSAARRAARRRVAAYALDAVLGWRAARLPTNPLLAVQADVYSGGTYTRTTGVVGTYLAPFNPQTAYLDTTTYLAPANLVAVAPRLELAPTHASFLILKLPFYWRQSTSDALYGSGRIYTFRGGYGDAFVGYAPQLSLGLRLTRHLSWTQDFARFLVSNALARAGGRNGTYYLSTLDFRF